MDEKKPLYACVRFYDDKIKNYYVLVKDVFYTKQISNHILPRNLNDFEEGHTYYVYYRSCGKDCLVINKCCKLYKAQILSFGVTKKEAEERCNSRKSRLKIPKCIESSTDNDTSIDDTVSSKTYDQKKLKACVKKAKIKNSLNTVQQYKQRQLLNSRKELLLNDDDEIISCKENDCNFINKKNTVTTASLPEINRSTIIPEVSAQPKSPEYSKINKFTTIAEVHGQLKSPEYATIKYKNKNKETSKIQHQSRFSPNQTKNCNMSNSGTKSGSQTLRHEYMSPSHSSTNTSCFSQKDDSQNRIAEVLTRTKSSIYGIKLCKLQSPFRKSHSCSRSKSLNNLDLSCKLSQSKSKVNISTNSKSESESGLQKGIQWSNQSFCQLSKSQSKKSSLSQSLDSPNKSRKESRDRTSSRSSSASSSQSKSSSLSHSSHSQNKSQKKLQNQSSLKTSQTLPPSSLLRMNNTSQRSFQSIYTSRSPIRSRSNRRSRSSRGSLSNCRSLLNRRSRSPRRSRSNRRSHSSRRSISKRRSRSLRRSLSSRKSRSPRRSLSNRRSRSPRRSRSNSRSLSNRRSRSHSRSRSNRRSHSSRRSLSNRRSRSPRKSLSNRRSHSSRRSLSNRRSRSSRRSRSNSRSLLNRRSRSPSRSRSNRRSHSPRRSLSNRRSRSPCISFSNRRSRSPRRSRSNSRSLSNHRSRSHSRSRSNRRSHSSRRSHFNRRSCSHHSSRSNRSRTSHRSRRRSHTPTRRRTNNLFTGPASIGRLSIYSGRPITVRLNESTSDSDDTEIEIDQNEQYYMLRAYKPRLYKQYLRKNLLARIMTDNCYRYSIHHKKVFLSNDVRVGCNTWKMTCKQPWKTFLKELARLIWKKELRYICLDDQKIKKKVVNGHRVRLANPSKLELYLSVFGDYLNDDDRYNKYKMKQKRRMIELATEHLSIKLRESKKSTT